LPILAETGPYNFVPARRQITELSAFFCNSEEAGVEGPMTASALLAVTITISAVVDRGGTQGLVARPRRRY
jgi:hypothetical protein